MNLLAFRTAVAAKTSVAALTTGAEQNLVDGWVNEGYEDVLKRTRCRVDCADMSLSANTWKYRFPTSILDVLEVWSESTAGQTIPFERLSTQELVQLRVGVTGTSTPSQYYSVEGSDLLMVYPTPAASQTLTFLYVPRPAALSATSDSPTYIPSEWHKAVEYYVLWQAAEYDENISSAQGLKFRQQYLEYLKDIRRLELRKGGRRLPRATVGRTRFVSSDPATDYR